jgi:Ca2+-binding EF-hand superfamily protein
MSEQESQNKPITEILSQELSEYGYDKKNRISRSELLLFLDRKSPDGKFNPALTEKLFQTLNLSKTSTISIEKFINGFSQFEDEIKKSAVSFNTKYSKEKE